MTRDAFERLHRERILIFDGATGTNPLDVSALLRKFEVR